MAKAKAVVAAKIKKKVWYPVLATPAFRNVVLGETYVAEPSAAIGRVIHANLKEVTNNLRDQNIYLTFKIVSASGNNLNTEIIGYSMTAPSIKKLTRRLASRLDESFVVVTQDGKKVRIKPVVVTAAKAVRSVGSALRKLAREHFAREVAKVTFSQLIERLVSRQLQSDVRKRLSKLFPVRIVEIKAAGFAGEGKAEKLVEDTLKEEKKEDTVAEEGETRHMKPSRKKQTVTEEMQEELEGAPVEDTSNEVQSKLQEAPVQESETFGEDEHKGESS